MKNIRRQGEIVMAKHKQNIVKTQLLFILVVG